MFAPMRPTPTNPIRSAIEFLCVEKVAGRGFKNKHGAAPAGSVCGPVLLSTTGLPVAGRRALLESASPLHRGGATVSSEVRAMRSHVRDCPVDPRRERGN